MRKVSERKEEEEKEDEEKREALYLKILVNG